MQNQAARAAHPWRWLRTQLPQGRTLPHSTWRWRHRGVVWLLLGHLPALFAFGLWMGEPLEHVALEMGLLALFPLAAMAPRLHFRLRTLAACLGLVAASALLTHFSGGYIEAHFHFFVMMGVIVLYEDWLPFLASVFFVAVHHGAVGVLDPASVYNHPSALAHPWAWAGIHAFFILAMCSALLVYWRAAETARQQTAHVLDAAGDGILSTDAGGRITYANPAAAMLAGTPAASLVGASLASILQTPTTRPTPRRWGAAAASGPLAGEGQASRPDGTRVPVEWTRRTFLERGGEGEVWTLRDCSAEREAQEAVQETLSLLSATLESTADGILVVDRAGRIVQSNGRFRDIWQIPEAVLATGDDRRAIESVLAQLDDPAGFLSRVEELYGEPEEESFDEIKLVDGRVLERYSRPQWIGGRVTGRVWSFRDVTERKNAEAQQRAAENAARAAEAQEKEIARLTELDRFKTDFINTTSHELRTPLTPIMINLHLLRQGLDEGMDPGAAERALTVLERNVARLESLVEDELELARLHSGRVELKRQPANLQASVEEVLGSVRAEAHRAGIELETALDPVRADVDETRLVQVLYNLVGNALKFTPQGGRVSVRLQASGGSCRIDVTDTGLGMTQAQIERMFQPFSRAHEDDPTAPGGTGLGLYICRSIVELHGGRIWCRSAGPGLGTTFSVEIPLCAAPASDREGSLGWTGAGICASAGHAVQVWHEEDQLLRSLGAYATAGLGQGEAVVAAVTRDHGAALRGLLGNEGFDVGALEADARLTLLTIEDLLDQLLDGDAIDRAGFESVAVPALQRARGSGAARVHVFGEIVDVLWHSGRRAAAMDLEAAWEDLQKRHRFGLYCGYHATGPADREALEEAVRLHDAQVTAWEAIRYQEGLHSVAMGLVPVQRGGGEATRGRPPRPAAASLAEPAA